MEGDEEVVCFYPEEVSGRTSALAACYEVVV